MAVYNGGAQIGVALSSLFAQSLVDWELIVIDDASSDGAFAIAEQFCAQDPRVSLRRLTVNVGPGAARNIGLAAACGDWVTVLDADDAYDKQRLAILWDRATHAGLDVIADNLMLFDEAVGQSLGPAFAFGGEAFALTPSRLVANDGPPRMIVPGQLKPFVRRSFLQATGVRYPEDIRVGEDFQFLFELLQHTQHAALIDYCGYRYTLPFSPTARRQSSGTRSSHGAKGLADLTRGNARLIERAEKSQPRDACLVALLRGRERRLQNEDKWRRARASLQARRYLAALCLLIRLDPMFGWMTLVAIANRRRGRIQAPLR